MKKATFRDQVFVVREWSDGRRVEVHSGITDGGFNLSPVEQLKAAFHALDHYSGTVTAIYPDPGKASP